MVADVPAQLGDLRELALQAGRLLLRRQAHVHRIDFKSATDMVTDLDREVEDLLLVGLGRLYPADAVEAEEGGEREGSSGRTWYIDPVDGTTNFVHGHPFYAVSLGCATGGDPCLGAVYAPVLDELYLAAAGTGAILERPRAGGSVRLPRRTSVVLADSLLATGFPYVRDEVLTRNLEYLRRFLVAPCHGVRRAGSAALDLCHVAAGRLDGYWEMKLKPWDIAGGSLVARETGTVVTDFENRGGLLRGDSILAAAPGLHGQMLDLLHATDRELGYEQV